MTENQLPSLLPSPGDLRVKYLRLAWRKFDRDLPRVALSKGAFFDSAEELCNAIEDGDPIADLVLDEMFSYVPAKSKIFPSDAKTWKEIAESLWNSSALCPRVRPFRDSTVIFSQQECEEILWHYWERAGNPLAFMFANPAMFYSLIMKKRSDWLRKKNWKGREVVTRAILTGYDTWDRTKEVNVWWYSPLVWWMLKNGDLEDATVKRLFPYVTWYHERIIRARGAGRENCRAEGDVSSWLWEAGDTHDEGGI